MESAEQKSFVEWMKVTHPGLIRCLRVSMTAITATLGSRRGAILKSQMKSQGVQFGEADIALCIPRGRYGSLVIEHKGERMPRKTTKEQQEYLDFHNAHGNLAISTRGLPELILAADSYLNEDFSCDILSRAG